MNLLQQLEGMDGFPLKLEESKKEYPTRKEMTEIGCIIGANKMHDEFITFLKNCKVDEDEMFKVWSKCRKREDLTWEQYQKEIIKVFARMDLIKHN